MARKIKFIIVALFTAGLLFLFSSNEAHAEETVVQIVGDPAPSSDTSTATSPVSIQTIQVKIEEATTILQSEAQTQSTSIITTIQANVPNTDTQAATVIATTQEPIATAVSDATVKVQEATSAIQSATTAIAVATTAQAAVESQTAVVAEATTNLNNAQTTLDTVTQQVESQTVKVADDIAEVAEAQASVESSTIETTTNGVTQTVYYATGGGSPQIANQTPISVSTVPNIAGQWGSGSVAGGPADHVIIKYEGTITAPSDAVAIKYAVYSDDGARMYVDGQLAIDNWRDQGPRWSAYSPIYNVTTNKSQDFIVWYYENGGGATCILGWAVFKADGSGYFTTPQAASFGTTTTITDPASIEALNSAQANLTSDTAILNTLQAEKTNAEEVVIDKTKVKATEVVILNQLTETAIVTVQVADSLANTAVTKVNEAVTAMTNASQVATNYYAEQQRIAVENARIAAELAAAQAAQERSAAEERARISAENAAKAEAARIAAEQAVAEAKAAQEKAEAEAKAAEEERIAAEQAAKEAQAQADKAAEDARIQAEKDAQAAADAAKAEAEKTAAELAAKEKEAADAALAEQKAKDEATKAEQEAKNAKAEADKKTAEEAAIKAEQAAKEKAAQAEKDKALANAKKATESGKELTKEEKVAVVAALVENLKPGESVSSADIKSSGVEFKDLPPSTPVEMRTSENGEVLVITAEVAAQVELVQDPAALAAALFTDPGAALQALGSIGADMTPGEREEATKMVVATVIASGAALNAVGAAAGSIGGSSGGSRSGGGNSGGSGGGGSSSESKGVRRRKP